MSADLEAFRANVPRETLADLDAFVRLFEETAAHTNLVARSTLPEVWTRHVLDSAQIRRLKPDALRWLDLGSGGGFPGIVTAILLKGKKGAHVDLVESTAKKAAFLRSAVEQLRLPASVWNDRVESLPGKIRQPEFISARALAPLERLLGWAAPWLTEGAVGLFHKGRNFQDEVQESLTQWRFDMLVHPSVTDRESAVLEIGNLRRR